MSDKDAPETVELAPEALDAIAERIAGLMQAKPDEVVENPEIKALRDEVADLKAAATKPARSELGDEPTKAGDAPVFYGGEDKYTSTGESDAEIATNLYLTSVMLQGVKRDLSPRARQVMLAAGERALKTAPAPINTKGMLHGGATIKAQYALDRADAIKALTSTGSGTGDEWVPTFATSELWRDIHLATTIASQIRNVDMPTNPYDLPTQTADPTYYYASSENVAVTASTETTAKATLTAKKIQAEVDFSGEVTEDSIIPVVSTIRFDLTRRGAQTIDDLIVHGDSVTAATGNVNSDDAAPSAGSFYLALDGMRKFCITTNTGQVKTFSAAPTTTLFNNTRALLQKYGARPSDLIVVTGVSTYVAMQDMTGVKLAYEYGPNATILTGELGRVFGVPIFLSEAIPGTSTDKVDADGKYTTTTPSSNDTKGWIVLANTREWVTGFRRGFQIESFRDIQKDQNILVGSFRMGLTTGGHATTHTAVGISVTV